MRGFTLIEILLGVAISVLIFITAGSVMVTLYNSSTRTKQSQSLEQTKNDLQLEFLNNVRWGEEIESNLNSLRVDETVYELVDGRINKNGEAITSSEVEVRDFSVVDYSTSDGVASLEISIELVNKRLPSVSERLRVVVSQRQMEITEGGG